MKSFTIHSTASTPRIEYTEETRKLEISGMSIPENARDFYTPLIKDIGQCLNAPISIDVHLINFNSASAKCLLYMFRSFEARYNNENKITWYYAKEDEDMYSAGKEYKKILNLPFILKPKEVEIDIAI